MSNRTTAAAWVLALAAVAAVSGCSAEDDRAAAGTSNPTTTVDPLARPLVGRYAHYDVVAYESADMKTLIISYGFTDLDVVDGELHGHRVLLPLPSTAATSPSAPPCRTPPPLPSSPSARRWP